MDTPESASAGLFASLRGFADGVLASAHGRLELLALEVHEEKHRLVQLLFWTGGLVGLAFLSIVFVSLTLVVAFWDTARLAVVAGLALVYVGGLIGTALAFRRFLSRQPKPFAGTMAELQRDRTCIRDGS